MYKRYSVKRGSQSLTAQSEQAEMNRDLLLHINVRVNPIPKQALVFTCLPYKSVKITLWEKEKLLVMSNYSFPPVFSPR